jgi:hypothetical protein
MNIADVNDRLRAQVPGLPRPHQFVMTAAVAALPPRTLNDVLTKIRDFNSFNKSNDPYGEHDFVTITQDGDTYFLKIDYYDHSLEYFQQEGGVRVFTLMFSHEY